MNAHKIRSQKFKEQFIPYCLEHGIRQDRFFSKKNHKEYVDTAVDGFANYRLYDDVFDRKYDAKTFGILFGVDLKSRLNATLGIATDRYEPTMLLEAPQTKKTSFKSYLTAVNRFNAHYL